jgi:hypothetical protein
MDLLEGLLKWWPLIAAIACQLVALGCSIQMQRNHGNSLKAQREDLAAHRLDDTHNFNILRQEMREDTDALRGDLRGVHDRVDRIVDRRRPSDEPSHRR